MMDWFDPEKALDLLAVAGTVAITMVAMPTLLRAAVLVMGSGAIVAGKFVYARHKWLKGQHEDIVNVTAQTTRSAVVELDTIVASRALIDVWHSPYLVARIKRAAKACNDKNCVVVFGSPDLAKAVYDPLIEMVADSIQNTAFLDYVTGKPMLVRRFVLALTF
jgi:hypothetical protein